MTNIAALQDINTTLPGLQQSRVAAVHSCFALQYGIARCENAVKIPVHAVKSPKRGRTPTGSRHHVSRKGRQESKWRVDV